MDKQTTTDWLFVLLDKGTPFAGWWLKITSCEMLRHYMEQTSNRYANAFDNFLNDKFYQRDLMTHGSHIQEAPITYVAWLYGTNHQNSMAEALVHLSDSTEESMRQNILEHGAVYVNHRGGYTYDREESGDFCHKKELVFPEFTENDIEITRFPGGNHWYARIGTVTVKSGERRKFNTYKEAKQAADLYLLSVK